MTKPIRFALGSFLLVAFAASLSYAQGVQRTFVSGLGNDGNPCSRTAPCRTLGQAISQTNAGGEVIVLDSAGYGAFEITQSVSVTASPGIYAGISVFSGEGISIITGSSDTVILRGLTINNQGSMGNGIGFHNFGSLHVENCVINGFSSPGSDGLRFGTTAGVLNIKDSIFRGNNLGIQILGGTANVEGCVLRGPGGGGIVCTGGNLSVKDTTITEYSSAFASAISIQQSSGTLKAVIDHITVHDCTNGVLVSATGSSGNAQAAIRDSAISNCPGTGIGCTNSNGAGTAVALVNVERCLITNGGTGLFSNAAMGVVAAIIISNCVLAENQTGYSINGDSAIASLGNNTISGNGNNTGTLLPFSPS